MYLFNTLIESFRCKLNASLYLLKKKQKNECKLFLMLPRYAASPSQIECDQHKYFRPCLYNSFFSSSPA